MSDGSPPTFQDPQLAWGMVESAMRGELRAVLAQPADIVKGHQWGTLATLAGLVSVCCEDGPPPGLEGATGEQRLANINTSLLQMLERALAARRRPRDMTKATYLTSLSALLAASIYVRELQHSQGWRKLDSSHTLFAATVSKVAAAMGEVTQLLGTQKQQQGGSQAAVPVQLQPLASDLLRWCAAGGGGILTMPDRVKGVSMQLRAVELAAALAQSLHTGNDRAAVERHAAAVLQVLDRVYVHLVHTVKADPPKHGATWIEMMSSPAFLQLNLALLVQLHQLAYAGGSSTDSRGPPCSSSSTVNVTAGQEQEQQEPAGEQERINTPLAAAAQQLLEAVGLPADTAALWLPATRALAARETFLQCTFKAIELQERLGVRQLGGNSGLGPVFQVKTLPAGSNRTQAAAVIVTQLVTRGIAHSCCSYPFTELFGQVHITGSVANLWSSDELSRQRRLLLAGVVWRLPQLLLQSALAAQGTLPLLTELAAEAAWCCCTAWQMPGLQAVAPAAAADSAAAGGATHVTPTPAEAVLPAVLDAWLHLMQQQLVEGGLLKDAAGMHAAGSPCASALNSCSSGGGSSKHSCSDSSSSSISRVSRAPSCQVLLQDRPLCSCYSTDKTQLDARFDRQGGRCGMMFSIAVLLSVLRPLTYVSTTAASLSVWRSKLPAVLLLLEVAVRQLLLPAPCSSSSSRAGRFRSSGAERLYQELMQTLFDLVYLEPRVDFVNHEGKQRIGPLRRLLVPDRDAGDHSPDQEQDQQAPELVLLLQQVLSVAASHLKACRWPAWGAQVLYPWWFVLDIPVLRLLEQAGPLTPGSPEVRALLAPSVALLGGYMEQAGAELVLLARAVRQIAADYQGESEEDQGRLLTAGSHQPTASGRLKRAVRDAAELLELLRCTRRLLLMLLEGKWQCKPRATGGSTAGSGSGVGSGSGDAETGSDAGAGSSSGGSTAAKGALAAAADSRAADSRAAGSQPDTQAVDDQGLQPQQQQTCSSLPAYQELQCELEQLQDSLLTDQAADCLRIVSAVIDRHRLPEDADEGEAAESEVLGFFDTQEGQHFIGAVAEGTAGFLALAQQVQSIGSALCVTVPVPQWCNNPSCTVLKGASELQLVGGQGCMCGGCRVARYCSHSCQAAHRAQHKVVCLKLSGAGATATQCS